MAKSQRIRKVGAHSNQETQPRNSSLPRLTVAPDSLSPPTGRKRKTRTLSSRNQESLNHSEHQAKKRKTSTDFSATSRSSKNSSWLNWDRAERQYWDSASRLWLTPSALRELNRRNALLRKKTLPELDIQVKNRPKDITHFARRGGPDLSDIRKYRHPEEGSSTTGTMPRRNSGTGKKLSAYDQQFGQHLTDNYVFSPDIDEEPSNYQDWKEVAIQPRASLSPSRGSDASYKAFVRAANKARNEADVMANIFPRVMGEHRPPSSLNDQFGNLTALTPKVVVAQPDYYEGMLPGPGNRTLRDDLDGSIVPSARTELPFLPTFFVEAKGPRGSTLVGEHQVRYDGALGARAMHGVQNHGRRERYDNKAYTASAILHGDGYLKTFTHHMTQPGGHGTPAHTRMTPLNSFALQNSPQSFREGRTALRNMSDKAHQHREQAIRCANSRLGRDTPERSRIAPSPRRQSSRLAPADDSDPNTSSEEEDSDDGGHKTPSKFHPNGKVLKPKVITASPERPARRDASPGPSVRRRRPAMSRDRAPSISSEEEPSRTHLTRPKILTATPKRLARREPSPPTRELRPRKASRRL